MPDDEVEKFLRDLSRQHRNDVDGGFLLSKEISRFASALTGIDRKRLFNELVFLAINEDRELWPHAIDALFDNWNPGELSMIESSLRRGGHSIYWENYVLKKYLALQYRPIAENAIRHISARINLGDIEVIPLLSAMCYIDIDTCLDLMAPFLLKIFNSSNIGSLKNIIQKVSLRFCDKDPRYVILLIEKIKPQSAVAANTIARLFARFITGAASGGIIQEDARNWLSIQLREK